MAFGGSLQNTSILQVGPDRVTDRHDAFTTWNIYSSLGTSMVEIFGGGGKL